MNIEQVKEQAQAQGDHEHPPRIMPKVLILGHGRHGKDTVAELMAERGLSFASSSLYAAEKVVRPALAEVGITYDSLEECYADRVNHRAFWYDQISAFNGGGKSRLAELILENHDVYVGMRSQREYVASLPLFDYVVWVDASKRGLPPEPRDSFDIDYDPLIMQLIDNNKDLKHLEREVDRFVERVMSRW